VIYSVWNWDTGQYDYFRGDGAKPGTKVAGRRARGSGVGGVRLEDALPALPAGAVHIGAGPDARGRVAVEAAGAGAGASASSAPGATHFQGFGADAPAQPQNPWLTVGIVLGGAWLAYRLLVSTSKVLW